MYTQNNPAEKTLEANASLGVSTSQTQTVSADTRLSDLIPGYLRYAQYDLALSAQTAKKYKESLGWVVRDIGDIQANQLDVGYVTVLKQKTISRGVGESRLYGIIFALKGFLRYCKDVLELPVLDYKKVKSPRRPRREVIFLSNEEINQFINSIKFENHWDGKSRRPCMRMNGLRFRTLVEVLLGTGMRIGEALSLNREQIDFEKAEAKIVGKGNKQRTVFLNDRAIGWLQRYLLMRKDTNPALFVTFGEPRPLKAHDLSKQFKHYAQKVGLKKKVTPHILRHTAATLMSHNGADIRNIQLILGHSDIKTTAKYYLGVDKEALRDAHSKFLKYD